MMMRGEYKTPGGKLVAVNVEADQDGRIVRVHVDGDFFVEAESDAAADALLQDIDHALLDSANCCSLTPIIAHVLEEHPRATLIGADASAIAAAFGRALAAEPEHSGKTALEDAKKLSPEHAEKPWLSGDAGQRAAEFAVRWAALKSRLNVVHDVPRDPAEQMAVDEQWAREVARGERQPTLRMWEWAAPAVVIGRFQSMPDEVNLDVAAHEGIAVVRRCTGGGAMFIEPGNTITYSLYAPLDFVDGISIGESYRLCDWWLVDALRTLGLDVRFAGLNDIASQHGKIGGAAQRRFPMRHEAADRERASAGPGSVLHHVTLAYDIDAEKMGRVLNTSREKLSDKAVKSAVKRVDPMKRQTGLSREAVIDHLMAWFDPAADKECEC